jgi:serine protease inhibitor
MKWIAVALVILGLSACTTAAQSGANAPGVRTAAAEGSAIFAELDRRAGPEANVFVSPISVEQAFGLLHAGAAGETRAQLEAFFNWPPGEAADRALEQQRQALLRHGTGADIRLANAIWLSDSFRFRPSYLAATHELYDATAETLDFSADRVGSARRVNDWAEEKTKGLIKQVVTPQTFSDALAALLTNAVYFEAEWQTKFFGSEMRPFLFGDGREEPFHLMTQTAPFAFVERDDWHAIRLPYRGGRFAMDVILPKRREIMRTAPASRTLAVLDKALTDEAPHYAALELPRFEIDYNARLKSPLAALGLSLPFDPARADLSLTAEPGQRPLFVSEATHISKLQVYEEGTKAAAVTVLSVMVTGSRRLPEDPVPFIIDRPFVVVIRDLHTGETLFIGRIADPKPYTPPRPASED